MSSSSDRQVVTQGDADDALHSEMLKALETLIQVSQRLEQIEIEVRSLTRDIARQRYGDF